MLGVWFCPCSIPVPGMLASYAVFRAYAIDKSRDHDVFGGGGVRCGWFRYCLFVCLFVLVDSLFRVAGGVHMVGKRNEVQSR